MVNEPMSFSNVLDKLRIKDFPGCLAEIWNKAQNYYDKDNIEFLTKEYYLRENEYLNLCEEVLILLFETLETVKNDEYLSRFLWYMHYVLYIEKYTESDIISKWPVLKEYLGNRYGMLDIIVFSSGIENIKMEFKRRGINKAFLAHTLYDIMEKLKRYYDTYKIWAIDCYQWEYSITMGRYVNIGRLQYEIIKNKYFKVFRSIDDEKTVAFFLNSQECRKDGLINGTNNLFSEDIFNSTYYETHNSYCGTPILPEGYVSTEVVRLDKGSWKCVLDVDDMLLNIHIPRRGKMEYDKCRISLSESIEFYRKYYPEHNTKAFMCNSWLLYNGFQKMLNPESNIVKFQQMFYLSPIRSDEKECNFYIFGKSDITGINPKTSLQKKVIELNEKGIKMQNSMGFILFDDVKKLGDNVVFYENKIE